MNKYFLRLGLFSAFFLLLTNCTSNQVETDSNGTSSFPNKQVAECQGPGGGGSVGGVGGLTDLEDPDPRYLELPPCAPVNVFASTVLTSDLTGIQISWEDTSGNETGFRVERRGFTEEIYRVLTVVDPDVVFYNDATALTNQTYSYRVKATGIMGDSEYVEDIEFTPTTAYQLSWESDLIHNGPRSVLFADLDQDGTNEIIVATSGALFVWDLRYQIRVYDSDGTVLWSKEFDGSLHRRTIVVANIDEDPNLEVVLAATNDLYVWKADGTDVSGFPVTLPYASDVSQSLVVFENSGQNTILVSTVSGGQNSYLYAYKSTGEVRWVKTLPHGDANGVAVGDINGDGLDEIVVSSYDSNPNRGSINVIKQNGGDFGLTITLEGEHFKKPILADVDGQAGMEIISSSSFESDSSVGNVYVYNGSGNVLDGWPKLIDCNYKINTSVGDLDGDGNADIIANGRVGEIHAWDHSGENIPGWPVNNPSFTYHDHLQPIIGDITGDGSVDVLIGDRGCSLMAFHSTGIPISGFPIGLSSDPTNCEVWSMALGSYQPDRNRMILAGIDENAAPGRWDGIQMIDTGHLASTSPMFWPTESQNMQRTCSLPPTRDPHKLLDSD